ncbi:aminodeoxychorismate synthase component I [Acinetobacter sp.]|uniref:aminodeoxychorismate synthase component I n=1 Tax=Acinetobacter sp. TaxID=472 RepID=UPI002647C498|nr:aminodeoxychorismate synthase component I [Acinetobacter sp.]MDN5511553.1 aminodeoxychorismate synthase component I [Acinetobacter sp.]MDN5524518.1 aminodeoxychorismate synthase component I [Acinetobacter sp.]
MNKSVIFEKLLIKQQLNPTQFLLCLSHLNHVVYLKNLNQPVIALFASEYMLIQNQKIRKFNRTSLNQYQQNAESIDFNHFFKKSLQNSHSDFNGGLIGFISYDEAAQQQVNIRSKNQPSLFLGIYYSYIKLTDQGWTFFSYEHDAEAIFQVIQEALQDKDKQNKNHQTFTLTQPCTARWSQQQYVTAFKQVQDYIRAGDCYQINLTQEFTAKAQGLLLDTAEAFWQLTDAPYSGYLKIDDFELLSCSPELFIDFEADRKITTKPIKGTMPRHKDAEQDEQSKQSLIHSKKDQAENVMIVDLLRNDLSVYAETGSVKTPKLFEIESFNQVHHMVSEVTATLREDVNPFHMLMSALPGGSITGAPKIRAMQIIEELEDAPRGAYCGSMGYFNFDGTGSWNILIRSIQKYQDDISVWAGGGITIASDCDAEYQECFDKVSAMLDLLNTWYKPE